MSLKGGGEKILREIKDGEKEEKKFRALRERRMRAFFRHCNKRGGHPSLLFSSYILLKLCDTLRDGEGGGWEKARDLPKNQLFSTVGSGI